MALIKLTTTDYDRGGETIGKRSVWINPDHIVAIIPLPEAERGNSRKIDFSQVDSLRPETRVYVEGNVGSILVFEPNEVVATKMVNAQNLAKL